jgi:hypothetical protein
MITADRAHEIADTCKTWNIVDRQLLYVNGFIEMSAALGQSKFNWLVPDDFTKPEVSSILDSLRKRGFETARSGNQLYQILW